MDKMKKKPAGILNNARATVIRKVVVPKMFFHGRKCTFAAKETKCAEKSRYHFLKK